MRENEHLSSKLFDDLLDRRLHPEAAEAAYLHLVGCFTCRLLFFDADEEAAALHLTEVFGPQPVAEWRKEIEDGLSWQVEPQDMNVYELLRELETLPPDRWLLGIANTEAYQSDVGLATLLEAAKDRWGEQIEESEILVLAARRALDLMRDRSHETGWAAWRGRLEAFAGNLQRIYGNFDQADELFDRAEEWLIEACSGPGQHATLAWLRGVLARELRQFESAAELLESSLVEPSLVGGYTLRQEIGMVLGNLYGEAGLPEKAIAVKEKLLRRHSRAELGPRNYLFLTQSLAVNYAHVGRVDEAWALLRLVKELATDLDLGVNANRIPWAEAEIWRASGVRALAASLYREVYQAFQSAGLPYDAALAALSLAEMHLAEGDTAAAAELAEELVPIFRSRGIHREATMAGLVLVKALQREAATTAEVQEVMARLKRRPVNRLPTD